MAFFALLGTQPLSILKNVNMKRKRVCLRVRREALGTASLGSPIAAHLLAAFRPSHVVSATTMTANARTSVNLNPRLSGCGAIFPPYDNDRIAMPDFRGEAGKMCELLQPAQNKKAMKRR